MKLQEISLDDNNYHVYQTEVSRTISWNSVKLGIIQKSTLLWCRSTFECELDRVCEYIWILLLWFGIIFVRLDYIALSVVLFTKFSYIRTYHMTIIF